MENAKVFALYFTKQKD